MTEYIIIVGLIAILLIAAVRSFSTQIQVTIEGSSGKVDDIGTSIKAPTGDTGGGDGDTDTGGGLPSGYDPLPGYPGVFTNGTTFMDGNGKVVADPQ